MDRLKGQAELKKVKKKEFFAKRFRVIKLLVGECHQISNIERGVSSICTVLMTLVRSSGRVDAEGFNSGVLRVARGGSGGSSACRAPEHTQFFSLPDWDQIRNVAPILPLKEHSKFGMLRPYCR